MNREASPYYIGVIALLFFTIIALTGCNSEKFEGSKTGNQNEFIMEYSIFTGTEFSDLVLEAGEQLFVEVVASSGKVNIEIGQDGDEPIYAGKEVPSSTFGLTIQESGIYTLTITGEKAKGSFRIIKKVGEES